MSAGRGTYASPALAFDFAWVTRTLGLLILLYAVFGRPDSALMTVGAGLMGLDRVVRG